MVLTGSAGTIKGSKILPVLVIHLRVHRCKVGFGIFRKYATSAREYRAKDRTSPFFGNGEYGMRTFVTPAIMSADSDMGIPVPSRARIKTHGSDTGIFHGETTRTFGQECHGRFRQVHALHAETYECSAFGNKS